MMYLASAEAFIREIFGASRREGSFSQNYLAVLSGTGLNIVVQIIVSPILTRLYGPDGYGTYALFTAICSNIALVSTMRFPQAFLLPRQDRDFHVLMRLTFLTSFGTSLLLFLLLLGGGGALLKLLKADVLLPYQYLIPVMIFITGANQIFGQWQYRLNSFKKSVVIDTGLLIGVRFFNLTYGWLSNGNRVGLVLGDCLGKTFGLLLSAKFIIKNEIGALFRRISFFEIRQAFLAYKAYPLLNLPGVWLILTSEQLPFFLLAGRFGLPALGLLSFAISMLDLPKRLFAYSVSSVFFKKGVDLYTQSLSSLQEAVTKMFYGLLVLAAVPYTAIAVFGPLIFSFVFGTDWELSGKLAQYLSCYYALELICVSFDSIFYILRREKQLFYFQVCAFVGRLVTLLGALQIFKSLEECVAALALFNILLYSSQLIAVFRFMKLPPLRFLIRLVLTMALMMTCLSGVKMIILLFIS